MKLPGAVPELSLRGVTESGRLSALRNSPVSPPAVLSQLSPRRDALVFLLPRWMPKQNLLQHGDLGTVDWVRAEFAVLGGQ